MKSLQKNEQGFILILSMVMLLIITILVVNSVRATTMNEKISGGYMDRSRAQNLAELAIAEGKAALVSSSANADTCRTACAVTAPNNIITVNAVSPRTAVNLPNAWPVNNVGAVTSSSSKASFVVTLLNDSALPQAQQAKCKPYSIIGRGEGNDSRTVVVLQVVASVCDLDTINGSPTAPPNGIPNAPTPS